MISTASTASFLFLQLLVGTSHAGENSLRGYNKEPVVGRFLVWDLDSSENNGNLLTRIHRGLQQDNTAITIPLVPIIIIIIAICCLCNRINQEQAHRAAQPTQSTEVVAVVNTAQPKLVTATATKFSPDTPVGVSFVVGTDYAEITRINNDSIFRDTELVPGMKVVSINNISISSGAHAAEVIAASKFIVTMLAHTAGYFGNTENFVTATACKDQPSQQVGVEYRKEHGSSRIQLKSISETTLFVDSELSSGMEIVAINNVKVLSGSHAESLTVEAFPLVTILARRSKAVAVAVDPSDDVPVATATVMAVQ